MPLPLWPWELWEWSKWFECNIPNFGPNTYRHGPIEYDDYLDVLFLYIMGWGPYCIWTCWFVLYIGRKPIIDDIYIYIYICLFVLGVDPKAHDWSEIFALSGKLWSTRVIDDLCWARSFGANEWMMICVERESLEHMSTYLCVEQEAMEHMKT